MANYEDVIKKDKRRKRKNEKEKCIEAIEDYIKPDMIVFHNGISIIKIPNPSEEIEEMFEKAYREGRLNKFSEYINKDSKR